VTKLLRLLATAVLVLVTIRILDWYLAPILPLLLTLFMLTLVLYIALGRPRL
jgi:hypothetical protein